MIFLILRYVWLLQLILSPFYFSFQRTYFNMASVCNFNYANFPTNVIDFIL